MIARKTEQDSASKFSKVGILNNPENAKKILKLTADTMFLLDRKGVCLDIEIHTDRWFLQDASYFLGKKMFRIIPLETSMALRRNFDKVCKTGKKSVDNYEVQLAGKTYFFKCILSIFDDDLILCQYRDITQRIILKKRIEIINRRLQEVEKVAKIGQWSINFRTRIIQFSGYTEGLANEKEISTIHFDQYLDLVHPAYRDLLIETFAKNQLEISNQHIDYLLILNEKKFFFRIRVISSYKSDDGDNILEGYVQNITDIMVKQHELEMITLAVKNSTDYIFAMDTSGKLVFGNQKFRDYHQIEACFDLNNLNFFESITPSTFKTRWQDIIHQLISSKNTLNFVLPRPIPGKPEVLAFDCTSYLVSDSTGSEQIWTFGKDITERVQYEKQVKELNQIMSTVLTNIPMNISVKDIENEYRYIFSNRMGKKMHWGAQDSIIGQTDFDLFPNDEAMKLRADDIESSKSKTESRRIIQHKDKNNNQVIFDQLRLLVEDDSRSLLISIERDITKDKIMEQELIDAKVKAEESDKLKSAFIANMSHEIRTPLNAIVGFSKIIADTSDAEERKTYYSIVETNNGRLLGLINEILDLSKIESGIMEFDMETVNLYALCRDIQQTIRLRCQPGVELIFEESDPNLILTTDKNRLSQVFNNLIGNAIKFTKKGNIAFGYIMKEDVLEFRVTDTGTGIPDDKVGKVFDRFIKGDNFTQGTGLGLPICKSIIEKFGGTIKLESKFGVGTTFTFTLPSRQVIATSSNIQPTDLDYTRTILVAEDTDANYLLLESIIGTEFILKRAFNGMDAVTMFQEIRPDIILMDIKMPIMNGIEATKIIRSISNSIPIIAQTAYTMDTDRNAAMQAGCNAFLTKPYNKTQILETLGRFFPKHRK